MFKESEFFNTPPDNTTVWRYMDLTKFLDVLENNSLFFASGSTIQKLDSFEGWIPPIDFEKLKNKHVLKEINKSKMLINEYGNYINKQNESLNKSIDFIDYNIKQIKGSDIDAEQNIKKWEERKEELLQEKKKGLKEFSYFKENSISDDDIKRSTETVFFNVYNKAINDFQKIIHINCWYIGKHESDAMWKIYLQSNEGIAIKSNISLLKKCFIHPSVHIGKLDYIDFEKKSIFDKFSENFIENLINYNNAKNNSTEECEKAIKELYDDLVRLFLLKRHNFRHEKELRIITIDKPYYFEKFPQTNNFFGLWENINNNKKEIDLYPSPSNGIPVFINVKKLIEKIYLSPATPEWVENTIRKVLTKKYNVDNKIIIKSKLAERPDYNRSSTQSLPEL